MTEQKKLSVPTPEEIKQTRKDFGLTQTEAAALVHCHRISWAQWETPMMLTETVKNPQYRAMHLMAWELFLLKAKKKRK